MKMGLVTGNIVASRKLKEFESEKLLLVQPLDENRKPAGNEVVALDVAQAGVGDLVIFESGREAAMAIRHKETINVSDATIIGVIDSLDTES